MHVLDRFLEVAHGVVYCSVATVDRRGRPRSRVMHPVWRREGDRLVGWVSARPTPLKRAHLADTPFVSCSYWDPRHDVAVADCGAAWAGDEGRRKAWRIFASTPAGFDPATIFSGPDAEDLAVIRLEPWRLRVATAAEIAAGEPFAVWRAIEAHA
jgi:hypothetical protein